VAVTIAAWAPALGGGFRYDDYRNVVHDGATHEVGALLERLPVGVRPLTRISYFLDRALWGMAPLGFLATNLALHLTAALLIVSLARRRLGSAAAAALAGALFAVQPAHEAAVAYVSGRSALLSTVLLLGGLLVWDRAGDPARRGGTDRRAAWGATALFVLAVLARETALVFPLLVLLWEGTRAGEGEPLRRRLAPFALPAALALGVAVTIFSSAARYRSLLATSLALDGPLAALAGNLRALPVALSLWVRPGALAIEHPPAPAGFAWVCLGAALLAGLGAAAVLLRRRAPHAALAAGWVAIALVPTHTFLARAEAVTERPLYFAFVGPALAAGAAALALARRSRPAVPALVAASLVLASGLAAHARARLWTDEAGLWLEVIARAPDSARAWNNLGAAYLARRDYRRARAAFRTALDLDPGFAAARAGLAGLPPELAELRKGDDPP
jgi:tetratricopeptide (TPR) repeat protein